jgi:AraC-like DNA-binding protein
MVLARWLARNYPRGDIRLGEMAAALGISLRTLQSYCRLEFGRTPLQLVKDVRLHQARGLLEEGSTAGEAARAVGYARTDRFRSDFRARYGTDPVPAASRRGAR